MNQRAIATKPTAFLDLPVALSPNLSGLGWMLNVGMGFQIPPEHAEKWSIILAGFDTDVLKFAALEYTRQRRTHPTGPADVGQLAGWLMRAIAEKRPRYTFRKPGESDAFAMQFLSACGADTQAFIAARAAGPRSVERYDDEPASTDCGGDDAMELCQWIAKTRSLIDAGKFESQQYGEEYLAFLEARLARVVSEKAVTMPP
jgi:hypothetical protein